MCVHIHDVFAAGAKYAGLIRHKFLWACGVSHTAWSFFDMFVSSFDAIDHSPRVKVEWRDPSAWSRLRIFRGDVHSTNTTCDEVTLKMNTALRDLHGWNVWRVKHSSKKGYSRRAGASYHEMYGGSGQEGDRMGGWTGKSSSNTAATTSNLRETSYLNDKIPFLGMVSASGHPREENPTAGGRAFIPVPEDMKGYFFGDIVSELSAHHNFLVHRVSTLKPTSTQWNTTHGEIVLYENLTRLLKEFDVILLQDAPVLQHQYPKLPRWELPSFQSEVWKKHAESSLHVYGTPDLQGRARAARGRIGQDGMVIEQILPYLLTQLCCPES